MHPVLFHIGAFPVRSYGTLVVVGFLLALWRAQRVCAERMRTEPEDSPRRIHPDKIFDLALIGLFLSILGARLLFVLLDWKSFSQRPAEIFRLWEGGLSLHGAMFAAILWMVYYARRHKLSVLALGDLGAPSWALAYAIGRVGCFLNGCCYGGACDLPWAVRFHDERYPNNPLALTPPSHPIQLYATLLNLGFFFLLTRWEKRPHRDGELFFGYIAMYGAYRFAMEAFRAGTTSTYLVPQLHLTETHVISLLMFVAGVLGVLRVRGRTLPEASPLPASDGRQ